jgi:hypothetical protein
MHPLFERLKVLAEAGATANEYTAANALVMSGALDTHEIGLRDALAYMLIAGGKDGMLTNLCMFDIAVLAFCLKKERSIAKEYTPKVGE